MKMSSLGLRQCVTFFLADV